MLNDIPLHVGENDNIFRCLRKAVAKMKAHQRLCYLTFDDVNIEPALAWDEKQDSIIGFHNTTGQSKGTFASKATVFMVRGMTTKWKQAIAYYFNDGSMSAADIAVTVKSLYRRLKGCGLQMMATVCDQGGTNTTAVNSLVTESRRQAIRDGREPRCEGSFSVDGGPDVVVLYDVPHLLKCVRNNFLEKNVSFVQDGREFRGTWDDVIAVYTLDQSDTNLRALPRVHDYHVYSAKLRKMKVSVAAQVFSQKFAALMKLLVTTKCKLMR